MQEVIYRDDVVQAICAALMDLPPGHEGDFDLLGAPACARYTRDVLAEVLASLPDSWLSAVAKRPAVRPVQRPTVVTML